jgi:hypothetical protein
MKLVALCLLVTACVAETDTKAACMPFDGTWLLTANGCVGNLVLKFAPDAKISGTMFDDNIEGVFDPKTKQVILRRLATQGMGNPIAVQVFNGTLSFDNAPKETNGKLSGTFRVLVNEGWGTRGVEYPWKAVQGKPSALPELLKPWQGSWDVLNKGGTNGSEFIIAEQLGLAGKQVVAVVRGNQMFVGDMLIATLTTDFSDSNLDVEKKVRGRKPVMFTLANGKGIMGAFELQDGLINIVHPYMSGNVSFRSSLLLTRSKKEPESKK